ncbi:aldehyde dehydrogenase family protein [uncultured Psychroserpens sp.]|uniref:aldehyde dehydrogenase family protein n=1 Tax=uncultured Psychroserpens sp. TaxID=255436 RepID=UPI002605365E|nr:aldehyde dehydrogenase family protein [uncultured Psychroserpens sp.]
MTDYSDNRYVKLFDLQKSNQYAIGKTTYKIRLRKLKALKFALEKEYKTEIENAIYKDFRKPKLETDLTEIYLVVKEIKYAISNLKSWLKPQHVDTPLTLLGTSSYIKSEPKGVCLIISPWNYPLTLTFGPLVSAIAAGNTAILKPSEMTPNTSTVMAKIVKNVFDESEVALIEGEVDVAKELLKLPFNHIFFTGSPTVGKIVMAAAAKHLSSVTLELGGKSPTIIHESTNIKAAIRTIVWGKFLNNGQTCIAPDYVLIQESIKDEFVKAFKSKVLDYYSANPKDSESYSRIVNEKHLKRLVSYIEDAVSNKATIELGGDHNVSSNYMAPTLISNIAEDAKLLNEEIFGPILPIKAYKTIEEAINYVNSKEKPLALYIYAKNRKVVNTIINNTRAGSTCINTNAIQYSNHYLPFGGSNNSGIGKAHGFFGFQEFSNARSVLKKHTLGPLYLLLPPYNRLKEKIAEIAIKWF